MKPRHAIHAFALITLLYLAALVWVDSRKPIFASLAVLSTALPVVVGAALLSYLVRFTRWHHLLLWSGHRVRPIPGLLAYMAGFAFTATPGKVGELVRIRYLQKLQVPASRTLAAFVFERLMDLLAVLTLACLSITRLDVFLVAAAFALATPAMVWGLAAHPSTLTRVAGLLRAKRLRQLSNVVRVLRDGLTGCAIWLRPGRVCLAFLSGLLAWSITSWTFVYLLDALAIDMPLRQGMSIYPIAMLAGAASMLPGGLGSTEAAIVALLATHGIAPHLGLLAAIGIRLGSLWFSVLLGLACLGSLEWAGARSRQTDMPA